MNQPRRIIPYDYLFYSLAFLLVVISFVSFKHIRHVAKDADETDVAYNISLQLNHLQSTLANAQPSHRAFLQTKDSAFFVHHNSMRQQAANLLLVLDTLTRNAPSKHAQVQQLDTFVQNYFDGDFSFRQAVATQLKTDSINFLISEMLSAEDKVLSRTSVEDDSLLGKPVFPLILGAFGLLIITAAYLKVRKEMLLRDDAEQAATALLTNQQLAKETENRLLNLADAVPVLAWLCNTEGSFYFFNRQWLTFTGRQLDQEKGKGWLEGVHPDDVNSFDQGFKEAFAKRSKLLTELRLKNKDQQYRWLSLRAVPMFATDGSFMGYAGGGMDIEKQKNFARELEEKVTERTLELKDLNDKLQLRNTVFAHAEETAMIGSYFWHIESGNLDYSDNFFRLLGYEPQEFTPSFEKFLTMVHPDDQEQVKINGEKTALSRTLFEDVYRIFTKEGSIRYFKSSGKFVGPQKELLVGTVQDVTKDTLLKDTLTNQNLELERNNAELSSFTYVASHDLQEPLRKIQSFSRLIRQTEVANLSTKGAEYFERMDRSAGRMQKLIESLLNYSRINHSRVSFEKTDLNLLLLEIQTDLGELLEERKVTIESEPLPTLNVMALQFYQLFSNIIINAIKYSKADVNPHIIITAEKVNGEDVPRDLGLSRRKFWKIVFSDNGIGFDAEYAEKVFELFQRLHGRTEYEGTGIGLAICRKIVNTHNGFITADGKPGVGAMFTVYLPEH